MGLFGDSSGSQVNVGKYINQIGGAAQNLYNQKQGFNAPKFQTYTPMSSQTQGALSGMYGQAQDAGPLSGFANRMSGDYQNLLSGSDNAAFGQAVQGQSDQMMNDIQRQFGGAGRLGSAADTGALSQQLGNFRSQALANNWNQNIANQRGILGDMSQNLPAAWQAQMMPYQAQLGVGQAYDAQAQKALQARLDKFNTIQQAPWNRLGAYAGVLSGVGNTATQAGLVKPPSNPLGGLLGGGLMGGQIGNSMGGYGGIGAGLGALGGLLAGL